MLHCLLHERNNYRFTIRCVNKRLNRQNSNFIYTSGFTITVLSRSLLSGPSARQAHLSRIRQMFRSFSQAVDESRSLFLRSEARRKRYRLQRSSLILTFRRPGVSNGHQRRRGVELFKRRNSRTDVIAAATTLRPHEIHRGGVKCAGAISEVAKTQYTKHKPYTSHA